MKEEGNTKMLIVVSRDKTSHIDQLIHDIVSSGLTDKEKEEFIFKNKPSKTYKITKFKNPFLVI